MKGKEEKMGKESLDLIGGRMTGNMSKRVALSHSPTFVLSSDRLRISP